MARWGSSGQGSAALAPKSARPLIEHASTAARSSSTVAASPGAATASPTTARSAASMPARRACRAAAGDARSHTEGRALATIAGSKL